MVIITVLSLILWAGSFLAGLDLSRRRPLWNDELYTQINTVGALSYADVWAGKSIEGNNTPLFYVIQKALCEGMGCELKEKWNSEWFVQDAGAQIRLRLLSNVFMSTAIAVLFFGVASLYPLPWAFMTLALFLALPATWLYWAEARPYSLWVLLTVLQSILILKLFKAGSGLVLDLMLMGVMNILLSMTITLGMLQACVASAVLWLFRKGRWFIHVGLMGVPLAIGWFYLESSPKFKLWFMDGPERLVLDNVPLEYWALMILCYCLVLFSGVKDRTKRQKVWSEDAFFFFAGGISVLAMALLGYLKANAGLGPEGFAISSRYFLFLIPSSVIAVTLSVRYFHGLFKDDPLMRLNLWVLVCGFLLLRASKTYIGLLAAGTFLHLIR